MRHGMNDLFDPARTLTDETCARYGITPERFGELAHDIAVDAMRDGLGWPEGDRLLRYPMKDGVVQLAAPAEEHLARTVPHVFTALEKIVRAHRGDESVRQFLQVPAPLVKWVDAAPTDDERIDLCRFDFVGDDLRTARVVEFNANCPGGIIVNGAYVRRWRAVPEIGELLDGWGATASTLEQRHWFPDFLTAVTDPAGGGSARTPVAIFHKRGGNTLELAPMAALLAERGRPAFITDPAGDDWLRSDARAGYLKYGVRPALTDVDGWGVLLDRIVSGRIAIVNPFPGRWIGDNKLCLALMRDPAFARMFSSAERAAIEQLIPDSRKAGHNLTLRELVDDRAAWVIKSPYDTRGNGVFIGAEHGKESWERVAVTATRDGWLAQEMIEPGRCIYRGQPAYQDLSVVLLRGRFGGYLSRISTHLRVNIGQGGASQLVLGRGTPGWSDGVVA